MADEIKLAAYQFAEAMPTNKSAELGALIIDFVQKNHYKTRLQETPKTNIEPPVCIACEG